MQMAKTLKITTAKDTLLQSIRWLQKLFQTIEAFFNKVSQILLRATGIIICSGGLLATTGWLLASLKPDPLGPTWNVAIWLVIVGVFLLVLGVLALTSRYILRIGMIGQMGIMVFLLGALALMAGAAAVDLFILPWMAKLFSQFPNFGAALQGAYNTVQTGVNNATSTVTDAGSSACKVISNPFGGSSSCSSTSAPSVPSQKIPSLGIDDILTKIGLPSVSALGTLGLIFLSGAPLAPGCLLVGLVFLMAGLRPRSALLFVIAAALLNLGGQFLLHVAFLGPMLGVLLFLSLAWLGFTLWSPWKFALLSRFLPSEGINKPIEARNAPEDAVEVTKLEEDVEPASTVEPENSIEPEGVSDPVMSKEVIEAAVGEKEVEVVGEVVVSTEASETADEVVTASEEDTEISEPANIIEIVKTVNE
jgi:hypothetical protein